MATIAPNEPRQTERPASTGEAPHVPGETGTWVFIFGDMLVFGVLFVTYLYYRVEDPALFATSQEALNQNYGAINTIFLLVSSLLVVVAVHLVRAGARRAAPWMFGGAIACGLAFSVLKVVEYTGKAGDDITPATNDFYMYYYVLTGLHWFHLLLGMGVLTYLFKLARRPALTVRQFSFLEGGAVFWHMVDLLWIVLFPLLYLVR